MKNKKAFTLIEVMVVMAIIAVLAVLIIGAIQMARRTSTETTNRANAKAVQTGLEASFAKYKAYCGVEPDQLDCGAAVSLATAQATLGLQELPHTCTAAAVIAYADGGRVDNTISATTYVIEVWNHDCGEMLPNDTLAVE